MKKSLTMILAVVATSATLPSLAEQGSAFLEISTTGPDCYADGTTVADGERYALVWTKSGATFAGITVEGKAAGSQDDNCVLGIFSCAADGHCPELDVEVPEEKASRYVGKGTFSIHLLDTRRADGTPGGKKAGVNGYGTTASVVVSSGEISQKVASTAILAENPTVVPDSISAPVIKSIEVKDGIVRLTVKQTSKLLRYGVSSGDTPADLAADATFPRKDGNEEADIVIEAPAKGTGNFFKVGRAPLK